MPCCGEKRAQAHPTTETHRTPESTESASPQRSPEHDSLAYFQYLGHTGLTVIGPRTGKRYRFDSPGAIVAVDLQDQRALATVSLLRQVRKPTDVARA
jgi:hypothetical protein